MTDAGARLITDRLILRSWRFEDREAFAEMNADPLVMEHFPSTLTRDESDAFADRIAAGLERDGYGLWAVEVREGAPFIGYVGLAVPTFEAAFTPAIEVGWRLGVSYWGRGYATEAAAESLRFAFEALGLDEVVSFTVPQNTRSRAVMERIGMTRAETDDFDHPRFPDDDRLRRHVLYRIDRARWSAARRPGASLPPSR